VFLRDSDGHFLWYLTFFLTICYTHKDMASILSVLLDSSRKHGLWNTIKLVGKNVVYAFRGYLDRRFDRLYGTDTCGRIELAHFDIVGSNRDWGIYYEPTPMAFFKHMMLKIRLPLTYRDFVFIDYGSGKGRTLLMASDYPFKSIVGAEFARELHLTAQKNIEIYRAKNISRQHCMELTSVHSDASSFESPLGNLLVYFYNPFLKDIMIKVLENLARVAGNNCSKVALIYFNPLSCDFVERSGMFVRRQEIVLPHDFSREQQRKCFVYFNWPADSDSVTQ